MRIATLRSKKELIYDPGINLGDFKYFIVDLTDEELFDTYMVYQYICLKIKRENSSFEYNWWHSRFTIIASTLGAQNILKL